MKRSRTVLWALLLAGLCGCMRSYHVEQSSNTNTALNSDGTSSCSTESSRQERLWTGPWVAQPDRIHP